MKKHELTTIIKSYDANKGKFRKVPFGDSNGIKQLKRIHRELAALNPADDLSIKTMDELNSIAHQSGYSGLTAVTMRKLVVILPPINDITTSSVAGYDGDEDSQSGDGSTSTASTASSHGSSAGNNSAGGAAAAANQPIPIISQAKLTTDEFDPDPISDGAKAKVFLKKLKRNKTRINVAVKTMRPDTVTDEVFNNEVAIMMLVSGHANIVLFYGILAAPAQSIVMEYVAYTLMESLSSIIQRGKPPLEPNDAEKQDLGHQLANGLMHLHQHQVAHLDLKPPNILLEPSGNYKNLQWILKICDFGSARKLDNAHLNQFAVTVFYCAPEILKDGLTADYDLRTADIFSFGLILSQLASGNRPYTETGMRGKNQLARDIKTKDLKPTVPAIKIRDGQTSIAETITRCFFEANSRPTARECAQDLAPDNKVSFTIATPHIGS